MQKLLTILFILFCFQCYSQEKINSYLSTKGAFSFTQQGILTLPNQVPAIQKTTTYNINPAYYRHVNSSIYLGLGLMYTYSKIKTENPNVLNSGQRSVEIGRSFSPAIHSEWLKPIAERLTFSVSCNMYYSIITYENHRYYVDLQTGDIKESKSNWKAQKIGINLSPNLRYLLFEKLGLQLSFAKIEWSRKVNDTRFNDLNLAESNLKLGFNIEDWQFGLYYNIN